MAIVGEKRGIYPEMKRWGGRRSSCKCYDLHIALTVQIDLGHLRRHDSPLQPCSEAKRGQALLGGLDVQVYRNFFSSQVSMGQH